MAIPRRVRTISEAISEMQSKPSGSSVTLLLERGFHLSDIEVGQQFSGQGVDVSVSSSVSLSERPGTREYDIHVV